jgi:hypothetical protein
VIGGGRAGGAGEEGREGGGRGGYKDAFNLSFTPLRPAERGGATMRAQRAVKAWWV